MKVPPPIVALIAPPDFEGQSALDWKIESMAKLTKDTTTIEIELADTKTMDSSGLTALLALNEMVAKRNGEVRLINPSTPVTQLLELTRLHRVFVISRERTAPQPFAQRPILVVEDEAIIRSVATMSLKPLGRPIIFAENGQEALVIARRDRPAVILLDYMMPLMDGTETLRHLKSDDRTKDIPVIIMSANEKVASGAYDSFEGASCFISKPFSPAALRGEVHNLIQEQREVALA